MSKHNKSQVQNRTRDLPVKSQVPTRSAPPVPPIQMAQSQAQPRPAPPSLPVGRPSESVMVDEAEPLIDPAELDEVEPVVDPADEPKKPEAPVDPNRELSLRELNEISKQSAEQARKARYENKTPAELLIIHAEDEANRIIVQARHQANAIIAQAQAAVANLKK